MKLTREEKLARRRAYYAAANKEKSRAYYVANKERFRANGKAWVEANQERWTAYQQAYYEANKEELLTGTRAWQTANREKVRGYVRAWARKNPEKTAYNSQKNGASQRGIPFLLTYEEWSEIWQDSGKWEQRGCHRGEYVMARFGDQGPYAVGNVRICTTEENNSEREPLSTEVRKRICAARWPKQR